MGGIMTRPNALTIVTVAALLLAGSASFLAYNYLKKQTGKPYQGVSVVSAAVEFPIGAKLDSTRVKLATWPKDALPPGAFTDPNALAGRVVVRPLSAGDIITESKLMPLNAASSIMAYMVPQGHRAVTVAVNEVAGVAGFITPSCRVDVVLTIPRPGTGGGSNREEDNISKIILQNVSVLASGQVTEKKDGKPGIVAPTVTLDLVPEDAEKLIVGSKKGSLQLLLRNAIDLAATDTKGSTISKALGVTEAPPVVVTRSAPAPRRTSHAPVKVAAAPPPPAKFSMEVIKGSSKSVREFAKD
jgi:pilus assembly protein CpaB